MTPIIKDRNGKILEVAKPGEHSKKNESISKKPIPYTKIPVMVHDLDAGTVSVKMLPFGHEQLSADQAKEQLKAKVVNSRLSKKLTKKSHSNPRKGMKGACKSDYIPYSIAMTTGQNLMTSGKNPLIGFYIIFSVNSGLRTSDIQNILYSDLVNKKHGDTIRIQEKKTSKTRNILVNNAIAESFKILFAWYLKRNDGKFTDDFIFLSQKRMIYTTVSLNRMLKTIFGNVVSNVSTHSLRKSFGREIYERANAKGLDGLTKLNEIFGHSNHAITRTYIGLTEKEIADCYLMLDEK